MESVLASQRESLDASPDATMTARMYPGLVLRK
jgi:hypothetical protein